MHSDGSSTGQTLLIPSTVSQQGWGELLCCALLNELLLLRDLDFENLSFYQFIRLVLIKTYLMSWTLLRGGSLSRQSSSIWSSLRQLLFVIGLHCSVTLWISLWITKSNYVHASEEFILCLRLHFRLDLGQKV